MRSSSSAQATAPSRPPAGSPSSQRRSSRSPCGHSRGRSRCGPRRPTGGHASRSSSARAARSPPAPSSSAPRGGPCSSPPRPWAPAPLRSGSASTGGPSSSPRWGRWAPRVLEQARGAAARTIGAWEPALVEDADDGDGVLVSIRIGQPPAGVLQLRCTEPPVAEELVALATFAGRVGHAVSLGEGAQELRFELERTRALLSVVGDAITHLSLAHMLETAVERIAELLTIERVGIYLREGRLLVAAGRGLVDGHEEVAEALLELALGPLRPRETIEVRRGERRSDARAVRGGARGGPCRGRPCGAAARRTTRRSGCSSPTRAAGGRPRRPRAARRPRRPARRRRPERAAARAGDGARRRARVGARVGAPGGATAAGALRDLELLHEQPLPRHDVAGDRADDRRGARRRRGRDPGARRAR